MKAISFAVPVAIVLLASACATTGADVRRWGERGETSRVIEVLREGRPTEDVRAAAAETLGMSKDPAALEELIKLSTDSSARVRRAAVVSLGRHSGTLVFDALLKRTLDEDADTARSAKAIFTNTTYNTAGYLIGSLDNGDFRMRMSAVQMLTPLKAEGINQALCQRAKVDDSAIVRVEAARAIGRRGAGECRDVLYRLKTGDPAAEVRMEAEAALAKVGDNVSKAQVVILPPAALPDGLTETFRAKVAQELTRRMVDGKLCEVLPSPVKLVPNPAENAPTIAELTGASQIIYFTAVRNGNRITVSVVRMDATGAVLQQEQATELDSKLDALTTKVSDLFAMKFGNK